jgi:VanZ family protein
MNRPAAALWLALAYGLFVVYGSLVPLDFRALPLDEAWARFQHMPFLKLGLESRADWVANGVLYAPLAFLVARAAFEHGLPQWLAATLAALVCCALAVGVEFTQVFFPARTVSQNDILAECIGSALGAVSAPLLSRWLDRLAQGWRGGGARLLAHLLELYAVVYVLLCFFPYDLLLSQVELDGKWQSAHWGVWLAPQERGLFFTGLQWLVEVAMALPIGALPALQPRRGGLPVRAAAAGLLLGLFIEVGQFFVSSGISQGASVLSRGLGLAAGAALLPGVQAQGWTGLRAALRPWALPLWAVYLPVLAAVNGAFKHSWHGAAGAWASWQSTHLLPFYYHYFTSEALALFSLGSVALMYLPVAALGWARGHSAAFTAALTAGLVLTVEFGKLFVDDLHADPTNALVAVAGNALALAVLAMAQRPSARPVSVAGHAQVAPARAGAAAGPARAAGARWVWLLALPPVAAWALAFPAFPVALTAGLTAAVVLVARWPVLALGLVPAALPVLDFAPWSGRFFLDEFDLLQAVCMAVAFARLPRTTPALSPAPSTSPGPRRLRPLTLAFIALALSLALSSLRALWPPGWPDDNSFSSYTSAWNALRIVKGAVWAWLFVALWRRLPNPAPQRARVFSAGVLTGLALTVVLVGFERAVFASLWDFAADFRVTGPFSAMHKGGASIECFLAVASAFALATVLQPGRLVSRWPLRLAALAVLAGAGYATMVTYSRNGYAALAVVLLASLLVQGVAVLRRVQGWRHGLLGAGVAALLLAVALPIALGGYARQRLLQSSEDLAVRQAHWADGLALRDGSWTTALIGMGVGRYPQAHYWRSTEPVRAASYSLGRQAEGTGERRYLRLGQGATLYIEQIIQRPDIGALRLSLDWRASVGQPGPQVLLCEKWTLTSLGCATAAAAPPASPRPGASGTVAPAAPAAPAASAAAASSPAWQHAEWTLDASRLLARPAPWRAPLKLSLLTPEQGWVDVTAMRLRTALGDDLLANGDFAQGMDRWFFATDKDPPWQLHSLPLAVLFDQGWLGVLAWSALALVALGGGMLALWRGQALVAAAVPALLGFAVSGALNTLIDAPRFLWLLLVLLWLAAARRPADAVGPPEGGAGGAP